MKTSSNGREPNRRSRRSSPLRDQTSVSTRLDRKSSRSRSSRLSPSATLLEGEPITDVTSLFEDLQVSQDDTDLKYNPRTFPYSVKQQCWEKAEKIKGRDPDRWRRDALGNIVFRKLVGCPGCLCHDYDHILPYSKLWMTVPLSAEISARREKYAGKLSSVTDIS